MTTRALVSGGSGFLGRHLVRALQGRYEVVDVVDVVDLRATTTGGAGSLHLGDVRDVLPTMPAYDAVFHLAATVGGRAGIEDGPLGVASNLAVDLAFFEYVARTRPAHAAYMSSSAVYPSAPGVPVQDRLREESVDVLSAVVGRPDGTYGWVKLTGEHLADVVRTRFGVPIACYRPFTVYGPEQCLDYPVPAIVARAIAREEPLTLWGSGKQQRDFVYVDDAIAAILATHDRADGAVNICTGISTSFGELATIAARAVGYSPEIVGDPSKPAGVAARIGCPERLSEWFTPQTTPAEGVLRILQSFATA
jgi:nucleoside-diphosphate-sugar epimerase